MRVVVLGGYGNFGARICRALASEAGIEVVAAGRRVTQDPAAGSRVRGAQLDIASPAFGDALGQLAPGAVIHCAGPFQAQDYRVAEAALDAGAHYIDLADGRHFVTHFAAALDGKARAAGLLAVSGASTVPALSCAVIDALIGRFRHLQAICMVIAPGQRAPRGIATLASVLSYAGRPFRWLSGGKWTLAWGWQELRRQRFAGLGTRWAAACDIPDLELLPQRYPGVETVHFRAALELGIEHLALWLAAVARRAGIPMPLERWAGQLNRLASRFDALGSDRGGMLIALAGTSAHGGRLHIEWHLTADAGHGPEIPCMAAILLVRKLARREIAAVGAYPCMGFLELADFEPELAKWRISTLIEERQA